MKIYSSIAVILTILFSSTAFGQTNFYFVNGKKVQFDINTSKVSVIFSNETTKSNVQEILLSKDYNADCARITNVPIFSFYTVSFKESQNIQDVISKLKTEENIIWVNPVFERRGKEFKIYNRFVAKVSSNISILEIEELNKKHHVNLIRNSGTGRYTFELTSQSDLSIMDMANLYYYELQAEWSMPDFIVPLEFYGYPNDYYFDEQWNFHQTNNCDIDAPKAWDISKGLSGIIVSVVDNGIESHSDLPSSRIVQGYNAFNPLLDTEPHKNEAHGMACAGLISASHNSIGVAGLAPECKIMPIQIADENNQHTSLDNIAAGFDYAWDIGDADIITSSWGGDYDLSDEASLLKDAIEDALELGRDGKGCVVLFASGNAGANYVKNTLATIDGVIAVGASDSFDYKPTYSNYGPDLDVVAPSSNALSQSDGPRYD